MGAAIDFAQVEMNALQLLQLSAKAGVNARLFGGIGINLVAPWVPLFGYPRPQKDIDIVVADKDFDAIVETLQNNRWRMDRRSLMFNDGRMVRAKHSLTGIRLDVFTDPLHLNQQISLGNRLALWEITLSGADLLLTKLQVAYPSPRDLYDALALIMTFTFSDSDKRSCLNVSRLREVCSVWRFYYSINRNLNLLLKTIETSSLLLTASKADASARVTELLREIETGSRNLIWKLRDMIGPRFGWYEDI
jgi:hypothetical protein